MATWKPSRKVLQWIVVSGCFLIKVPMGIGWYFGNLASYMYSYFLYKDGEHAFDMQPEWLLATFLSSTFWGIMSVDYLTKVIPLKYIQLGSILMSDVSILLTYFTVQQSIKMVLISFTLIGGLTLGTAHMIALKYVAMVAPERVGTYTAFTTSGLCVGGALSTFVITEFINPENLSPDIRKSELVYFSQTKLLEKVPDVFLVLGVIFTSIHFVGYSLQQIPIIFFHDILIVDTNGQRNDSSAMTPIRDTSNSAMEEETCCCRTCDRKEATTSVNEDSTARNYETCFEDPQHSRLSYETEFPCGGIIENHSNDIIMSSITHEQADAAEQIETNNSNANQDDTELNLKPFAVLWTRQFYILWCTLGLYCLRQAFFFNFFKLYAQIWIHDDFFLSTVGSVSIITAAFGRVVIGFFVDAYGVRNVLSLTLAVEAVFIFYWSVSAQIHKWFYFLVYEVIIGIQSAIFVVLPLSILELFGPLSYASNYGLLFTAAFILNLSSPPIFSFMLSCAGWFATSLIFGLLSVISAGVIFLHIPARRNIKK